ncbi:hypothetical protein RJ640_025868 [Escallonia rubra]|uniref:Large ribosomal subunit protein uL18c n=1 Tax=Escallonia rubra TaxID=112253 RepID=A0AA88U5R6_9ASTE|nr:hypothetical protein RJ640_025868 [Escallonia rubra]
MGALTTTMSSLSFLQSGFAYSQQQQLLHPSKLVSPAVIIRPQYQPLIVDGKARTRRQDRTARHSRLRKKVEGTPERPRLCVFRSNKHLYVQVIDDTTMHTLASASTMQKPISEDFDYSSGPTIRLNWKDGSGVWSCVIGRVSGVRGRGIGVTGAVTMDVAKKVGEVIARSCIEKGINCVAFDRGGYPYHGRIQALADAAREHGLMF